MPDRPPGALTDEEMFGSDYLDQNAQNAEPRPPGALTDEEMFGSQQQEPDRQKYTPVEAGAMGAAQGALFDFGDELYGGGKALYDIATGPEELKELVDVYRKRRDEARKELELASEDQPIAYTGGQIAGSIGTGFIPGLGMLNAAKGAGYLGKGGVLAKGALSGALGGAGVSEAETIGELGRDIREGAGYGMAAGGLLKGAGQVASAINPRTIGVKGANIVFNTPEELTENYLRLGPQRVEKAPTRQDLVEPWDELKDRLKSRVIEGSKESRDQLKDVTFKGSEVASKARNIIDRLKKRSEGIDDDPQRDAARAWLEDLESKYKPKKPKPAKPSGILDEKGIPYDMDEVLPAIDKTYSGSKIKDSVQAIDRNVEWPIGGGKIGKIDQSIKKEMRKEMDSMLKGASPAYGEDMEEVARLSKLLKRADEIGTKKGLPNAFRRAEVDEYGAGAGIKETIQEVDKALGSNFMEDVTAAFTREAFDKSITNGSQNVQKFRGLLEGYAPLAFLKPFAGFLGAAVDKYGRKITMGALNLTLGIEKVLKKKGIQEAKRIIEPMRQKAKEGNYSAMIALQILEQTHKDLGE